jgi:S-DNA-T family DNA segregation ATPase FtsK/SpoIIIE
MATIAGGVRQERGAQWRQGVRKGVKRSSALAAAAVLLISALLLLASLATYRPTDPSLNTAAAGPVLNWMGTPGAYVSDLLLSLFGPPAGLLLPLMIVIGLRFARGADAGRWGRALLLTTLGLVFIGTAAALLSGQAVNGLPASWGGALGLSAAKLIEFGIFSIGQPDIAEPFRVVAVGLSALTGLFLWYLGLGLRAEERQWLTSRRVRLPGAAEDRKPGRPERAERASRAAPDDDFDEPAERPVRAPVINVPEPQRPTVINDRVKPDPGKRPQRERQSSLALGDTYRLPTLDLLSPPPATGNTTIDKASLERNARLLESVLEDFSVKGEIVEVRPGPVVTMYELEPASGIKASRVIQLADDIARNMSALSARVATIPGRSVIGIELPKPSGETVTLSELIASTLSRTRQARCR